MYNISFTATALVLECLSCIATVTTYDNIYRNYETIGQTYSHSIDNLVVPVKDFQHAHVTVDNEETKLYARRPYNLDNLQESCYGIDFDCFFFQNNIYSIVAWCVLSLIVALNTYIAVKTFILSNKILNL